MKFFHLIHMFRVLVVMVTTAMGIVCVTVCFLQSQMSSNQLKRADDEQIHVKQELEEAYVKEKKLQDRLKEENRKFTDLETRVMCRCKIFCNLLLFTLLSYSLKLRFDHFLSL